MTRSKRRAGAALTVAIAAAVVVTPGNAVAAPAAGGASGASSQVTLITGDRVTVHGAGLQVTPAARAHPVAFQEYSKRGDKYVIPADAAQLVQSGRLDQELFNVTGLLRQGYDDAHTPDVSLLVQYTDANARVVAPVDAKVRRSLPSLGVTAMDVRKSAGAGILAGSSTRSLAGGVQKVWLNRKMRATLDESVPQIGAPAAWQAGYTGNAVQVAVLDTGIDTDHPDLTGKVAQSKDFSGKGNVEDGNGHGTHVASTVTGSGAASGGKYKGVAPGATLAVGKVLDDFGSGTEDTVLAGMQWAAAEVKAKVVNMSLGSDPTDGTDPISVALNTLSRQYGTLFVVAAGNYGQDESVGSPGSADDALTVASVSKKDELSPFSSRGPRAGDGAAKPEIAAPGGGIVAARPAGVPPLGEPIGDAYQRLDGTSMATPHVAGAAAILAQQHPDWTGGKLKAALVNSATEIGAGPLAVGTGRLDVARAIKTSVLASGSASVFLPWPNQGQQKKQTVTWTNTGTTSVTLDLQANLAGAPAGLLALSANSVTVPAGGSAPVEITVTAQDGKPGTYGGILTARTADGAITTRTVLSVRQQEEMHTVDVSVLDRNGQPAANGAVFILNVDNGNIFFVPPGKVQLPRGRYAVNTDIVTSQPGAEASMTLIAHPGLDVDHDLSLVLDARIGQPVSAEPDNPAARGGTHEASLLTKIRACACTFSFGLEADPRFTQVFAGTVPGIQSDTFAFAQGRRATEPVLELTANDAKPYAVPSGWLWEPDKAASATLPAVHGGSGTPEDLAKIDAHGKLVLISLPRSISRDEAAQRVANVKNAGGTLAMIVFADDAPGMALRSDGTPDLFALPTLYSFREGGGGRFEAYVKAGGATASYVYRPVTDHRYDLIQGVERQLTTPQAYRPRTQDLVAVRTAYHDNVPSEVRYGGFMEFFGRDVGPGFTQPAASQQERTEYYTPGKWDVFWSGPSQGFLEDKLDLKAGKSYRIVWNKAVAGPSLRGLTRTYVSEEPRPWVWRKDGAFSMRLPLFGDSAGRPRDVEEFIGDTGSINLYRDGSLVKTVPVTDMPNIPVPDQAATYRLTADVNRNHQFWPLWTKVSVDWTFRSSAADEAKAAPLLTTRFDPAVDLRNRAPRGFFAFPAYVERQDGKAKVTSFTVDVSYDDGATWKPALALRDGDRWTVGVLHPHSGYASLRAHVTDSDGNKLEQTVIRAYQIR